MPAGFNLQQAVPITFGFKMARLLTTLQRHRIRLAEIRPRIEVFEFGDAAGTLATLQCLCDGICCLAFTKLAGRVWVAEP